MTRILHFLFGAPPPPSDDDVKATIEQRRRELDQRSKSNRTALTEIQVAVLSRRGDIDAR
jgi:hypothetical protein